MLVSRRNSLWLSQCGRLVNPSPKANECNYSQTRRHCAQDHTCPFCSSWVKTYCVWTQSWSHQDRHLDHQQGHLQALPCVESAAIVFGPQLEMFSGDNFPTISQACHNEDLDATPRSEGRSAASQGSEEHSPSRDTTLSSVLWIEGCPADYRIEDLTGEDQC